MKTTKILLGLALVAASLTGCKEPKLGVGANAAYISDAASTNSKIVAADNSGCKTTLLGRIATPISSNVTFEWTINPDYLKQYNAINGTSYQPLPAEYFTIGKTLDTIKTGLTNTKLVDINIKSISTLPESAKYAIPVAMTSIKGLAPLASSTNIVIIVNRVIETSVAHLQRGYIKSTFAEALKKANVTAWTAEFLVRMDVVDINNQALFMMYPDEVYSRLGDMENAAPNEMQVKTQGQQPKTVSKFEAEKWYHIALVYNGANVSIVIDGKTDVTFPSPVAGFGYKINEMQFGNENTKVQVAEVRLWTEARSNAQLNDLKYAVEPTTPGLLVYWKCNEGSGNDIKDYTGHGYDAQGTGNLSWVSGVRFPDNK